MAMEHEAWNMTIPNLRHLRLGLWDDFTKVPKSLVNFLKRHTEVLRTLTLCESPHRPSIFTLVPCQSLERRLPISLSTLISTPELGCLLLHNEPYTILQTLTRIEFSIVEGKADRWLLRVKTDPVKLLLFMTLAENHTNSLGPGSCAFPLLNSFIFTSDVRSNSDENMPNLYGIRSIEKCIEFIETFASVCFPVNIKELRGLIPPILIPVDILATALAPFSNLETLEIFRCAIDDPEMLVSLDEMDEYARKLVSNLSCLLKSLWVYHYQESVEYRFSRGPDGDLTTIIRTVHYRDSYNQQSVTTLLTDQ